MHHSMLRRCRVPQRPVARLCAALATACMLPLAALAAALPAPPQTFDSSYHAPTGAIHRVAAGASLQAALDTAKLGDTIVLQAGATFRGPFRLPNKTVGSGWIYVVSSNLSSLPAAGTRVSPANATNMPKVLAPNGLSALVTVAGSHHFRFVGIELAPEPGTTQIYQVVAIGNADTSPATLAHHIVFDRCYVHGIANSSDRRGIEMDGAYVAVVDSYISGFQDISTLADSQGLWAYNTTGPLQIHNNYIEAASENVLFGGSDSRASTLVPTSIEISGNYFYKPLSLISSGYAVKNLLEFKAARRVLVTGNTFQNNPAKSQNGFALLITPRNGGKAPWTVTSDIAIVDNRFINVGSGFNLMGRDANPTLLTQRLLIRDNVVGVTGLNGAAGRAFQFIDGGSDYTITHNTIIDTAPGASDVAMADTAASKVANLVFTNNLATFTAYGFFGSGVGEGTRALNGDFTYWTFSKNVLVGRPAGYYPSGNFFPASVAAVGFVNYAGGNYALAASSPYKDAGTDGADIGAILVP
ncbi:MAG TPA: hypothetical protein VMT66_17340 [Steroidobacteraceae bacterium]|nr:hypothetical protein [Steroidobacteraceae bacterium]